MILTGMGSYPRVGDTGELQRLRRGIHRFDRNEIDREDLNAIADDVTAEVIREQVRVGLDWVTDGCIRWEDMVSHVANKLPNIHRGGLLRYFDSNTYVRQPVVTGAVGWEQPVVAAESAFAVAESPKPVKAVVTGPYTVAKYCDDQHYGALEPLVMDLAAALNNELKAIAATGVACMQIDEPSILQEPGDWALFARAMNRLMDGVPGTTAIATYFGDAVPLVSQLLALPFNLASFDCSYAPLVVDALRGKVARQAHRHQRRGRPQHEARIARRRAREYRDGAGHCRQRDPAHHALGGAGIPAAQAGVREVGADGRRGGSNE